MDSSKTDILIFVIVIVQCTINQLIKTHEKTLKIQAECEKYVTLILQYRKEMEEVASRYLGRHIETFEAGFQVMMDASQGAQSRFWTDG